MSREWYIRTDKRHIQSTFGDIDTRPLTPKEKWQKNKGKYILWGVEILVVIALLAVTLPALFRNNTPDYTVTVVTVDPIPTAAETHIPALLKPHAVDRDGDGEIEIEIRTLAVGKNNAGGRNPALETLISSFYTEEYTFFVMEPTCYTQYVAAYTQDGTSLFSPVAGGVATDGSGTLLSTEKTENLPAFYWGVRLLPNAKGDALDSLNAHKTLLEAFAKTR